MTLAIVLVVVIAYAHELNLSFSLMGGKGRLTVHGENAMLDETWLVGCIMAACKALQGLSASSIGSGLLSPLTMDGSILMGLASLALYVAPLVVILLPQQREINCASTTGISKV